MRRRAWRLGRVAGAALLAGPALLILLFRFVPPPATPLMLLRFLQGYGMHQEWVPYRRIAPALAEAVVASEDNLFCAETLGFDFDALRGQIAAWAAGGRPRGASTLTQQTAKNLLLWPGRDPVRKLAEAWLTPQLALLWPKRRVIETYLNIVEFGPGIYGAEAASRAFFGKPASRLTRDEAARLAVVLPAPLAWSAARPTPSLRMRAAAVGQRIAGIAPLLGCLR